ncbi:MAG: alpha-1,4-glucan--maltose-1-phosphate maltosyltransferase [Nitrospirae bacterium]|nr:alpha-1,4-glucan--maltose-1-phosphate maltosyltransferase [Nitrospirota bacterium]MBF0533572.1 alpha-1,4-glucan--maltose-1-phosphate maltosyltransferase [Nitrospirota bacterium]MBF0618011.1 alpha-1,4-glucan--maltose-1-phosphate maltosyltransferase [Nitrospirota bacterium]
MNAVLIKPFVIEAIVPSVDGGKFPVKREVGETLVVTATVYRDGHDVTRVNLKYKEKYGDKTWQTVEMESINSGLDLWRGAFLLDKNTRYIYTIEAYTDTYQSWLKDTTKKFTAGADIASELTEGEIFIKSLIDESVPDDEKSYINGILALIGKKKNQKDKLTIMSDAVLTDFVTMYEKKPDLTVHEPFLEVVADRERARYAAWYEIFPRSQGNKPGKSATFKDCIKRLPEIKEMGFDVLYLTPIHPIGVTKRKGPNNSLNPTELDPGCPYAIGSTLGGHKAVEPGLGTLKDFDELDKACKKMDMEIALDFAINCSPDHPYVKEHPEWFFKRPDGSIKYAENPPKKYEDIYPLNFYAPGDAQEMLWTEMKSILEFWIKHGVRIFRVDNPHTKPIPFWHWLITELQRQYPDVIFLAEAFTRPPMMRMLAKVGFSQSYTYFTWRNFKGEITEYFTELTHSESAEYMRGNLFANTPDILPRILQIGSRPAFKMRFVLAATLSSVYGIYSGYELCENTAITGKEEYFDSEKYDYKVWDWDRAGNIKDFITKINRIRRENEALHNYKNLRFYHADNENILFYGKTDTNNKNIILCAVNLDPFNTHSSKLTIPIEQFGIAHDETYELQNLINGERTPIRGQEYFVTLNPDWEPGFIYKVNRWVHTEDKFDYFNM